MHAEELEPGAAEQFAVLLAGALLPGLELEPIARGCGSVLNYVREVKEHSARGAIGLEQRLKEVAAPAADVRNRAEGREIVSRDNRGDLGLRLRHHRFVEDPPRFRIFLEVCP